MSADGTARGLASGVLGWCPSPQKLEISRRRQHGEKRTGRMSEKNRLRMRISISNLRAAKKERHRRMAGLCQNEKVQELLKLSDLVIWLGTGYELQVTQLKPLNDGKEVTDWV